MSKQVYSKHDTDLLKSVLGPRIKAARKALGITQAVAAKRIGISPEFYARMERGHAMPSVSTLKKIALALDVTVDYLFGGDSRCAPIPPPAVEKTPRQISYIVSRARKNPDLTRVLTAVLKLCDTHIVDEDDDEDDNEW